MYFTSIIPNIYKKNRGKLINNNVNGSVVGVMIDEMIKIIKNTTLH